MIGLYTDRPARRGASTGDAGLMEQAGCAAGEQASGPGRTKSSACAAPARLGLVSRTLGRLRDPPWGYYGPCARSSLTARFVRRDSQARTGAEAWPQGDAQSRQWSAARRARFAKRAPRFARVDDVAAPLRRSA